MSEVRSNPRCAFTSSISGQYLIWDLFFSEESVSSFLVVEVIGDDYSHKYVSLCFAKYQIQSSYAYINYTKYQRKLPSQARFHMP